jgi:hypothetical protein
MLQQSKLQRFPTFRSVLGLLTVVKLPSKIVKDKNIRAYSAKVSVEKKEILNNATRGSVLPNFLRV